MSVFNPTSRPIQPELPPLTTRRARRNAEHVIAARTGQIDAVPKASAGRRAARLNSDSATRQNALPEMHLLIDRAKASGTTKPTPAAASRRGQSRVKKHMNALDKALVVVVVIVGLLMFFMGIVGIATTFMHYQFDPTGFFNSSITVIAGVVWLVIAPFKVIESSE